jgi:hypothetical protein
MPAANRSGGRDRRLTRAGLIAISAATLLMMAWAVFPGSAVAAPAPVFMNGNPTCADLGLENASATTQTSGSTDDGTFNLSWTSATGIDAVIVKGGPGANVYFYNEAMSDSGLHPPLNDSSEKEGDFYGLSHVLFCADEDETTTTETTPTETTTTETTTTETTPTETTTTETTTTETTTTETTPTTPTTTTGSPTVGPTSTTTTTGSPTVGPTSTTRTTTPVVAPTTVRPGGTAFTGVENVVPLGAIALMLMTGGSGLLWLGSRRRRNEDDGAE